MFPITMSFDVNPFSSKTPSKGVIDLSTSHESMEVIELTLEDDVQIVTPHRTRPYNVMKDIQTAISKGSFSAMYPDDIEHVTTSNDNLSSHH